MCIVSGAGEWLWRYEPLFVNPFAFGHREVFKMHSPYTKENTQAVQNLRVWAVLEENQERGRPPAERAINKSFSSRMNPDRLTKHGGQRCQLMIRILSLPGHGDMSLEICHLGQRDSRGKGKIDAVYYPTHYQYRPLLTFSSTSCSFPVQTSCSEVWISWSCREATVENNQCTIFSKLWAEGQNTSQVSHHQDFLGTVHWWNTFSLVNSL